MAYHLYGNPNNIANFADTVIYQKEFSPEKELIVKLEEYRKTTEYPGELYDNYIEVRIGMVNFSVLGRNCPYEERNKYSLWDKTSHERERIASELKKMFPQYDISIGGSISMDITPKGCGKEQMKTDVCALLETNLDDVSPEVLGHVQSVLMESGALDVWLTPILMKKGRPAQMLSVLVKEEALDEFALRICRETGTLGVRVRRIERRILDRSVETRETEFGPIRFKSGILDGEILSEKPEFEDCAAAAKQRKVPLKDLLKRLS